MSSVYWSGTAPLAALADIDGVGSVSEPTKVKLTAAYFDTADLDLARRAIALRRRTGGPVAGWQLSFPDAKGAREEVRLPLGRATKTVPSTLLDQVRALVRDRKVSQVVRVTTRRLEYDLLGEDDLLLARFCDDEVHAERMHDAGPIQDWREWQVTLVEGGDELLDTVQRRLLATGAKPAPASLLSRALGDLVPPPPEKATRKQLARGDAAGLLRAHLAEHLGQLHKQDARLRADLPGAVHKLRIASRRLRSALKTYRPLLAAEVADSVGGELRWLGQTLSTARDAQVMREHLLEMVDAEPAELVLGPVRARIDDDLRREYQAGHAQAVAAMESERYFRLLDALDQLVESPVLTPAADAPIKDVLPGLLRRDTKRLRRSVRAVGRTRAVEQRDLALHEARKKAKRLRYAAESAAPVLGRRADRLAISAKRVQEALGEHQDSVVARGRLRDYGAQTHTSGENGFTFGRLHAFEQTRGEDAVRLFEAAWRKLDARKWPH